MDRTNLSPPLTLEIKTSQGYIIVRTSRIVYIEACKKYSTLHFDNLDTIITFHMLKWFDNVLAEPFFFRSHNSFIINCELVESYCCTSIKMITNERIPLSRKKLSILKNNLRILVAR